MLVGMRSLINFDDCLRYSLIPPVMVSILGENNITPYFLNKYYFQQPIDGL
jgi:hypothetical protein